MTYQKKLRHKWGTPAKTTTGRAWTCTRCNLAVTTIGGSSEPKSVVHGRTVGGVEVGPDDKLPDCVPVPDHPELGRDPRERREHELRTCIIALGKSWVERAIGKRSYDDAGDIDPEWELKVLRLYTAVRALDLDALALVPTVHARMRDVSRQRVGEATGHQGADQRILLRGR